MPFAHIQDWVFDLDNTLYPAESTLYQDIGRRMTAYVARLTGLDAVEAEALQERYFYEYGATIVGLVRHHGVDAADFLADVHDVDVGVVAPDPELAALIGALPGRKFIFTNGGGGHGQRLAARLGLDGLFDGVFDIESVGLTPKPQPEAYRRLVALARLDPPRAVLVEDTLRNLEPAATLGFTTVLVGPVHPDPPLAYVHHAAHDVKSWLRTVLRVDRNSADA